MAIKIQKKSSTILGADTETHKGYARLLCIENNLPLMQWETGQWRQWLEYLLNCPGRICFYNLRFDVEAILKHFPESFVRNLLYLTEAEIQDGKHLYTFKLIPWKVFTIRQMITESNGRRRTVRKCEMFECAQFYAQRLQDASKKVLGESKVEDTEFAESLNVSEHLWQTQLERIIEYCQDDATKAGKLMRKFQLNASEPPLNLNPKNPISCAWYAKELIRQCIPEIKQIKSIRTGSGYYYARPWKRWDNVGTQCYIGGRFEAFKKGAFNNVFNADINSAYPDSIAKLPNPYNLLFVKDWEPEGPWCMVKAEVWVPDDIPVCPLPYRNPDSIIFPSGNWTAWFHWQELKNAERFGVEFDIQKCLNGYEPEGEQRPFGQRIPEFYDTRLKLKALDDPRELPYKVSMNSVYGVFYEKNERITESEELSRATEIDGHHLKKSKDNPGRFFHPYLAGWITSQTRIKLLNACIPDSLIFFATDGILSEKPLNIPVSKQLGEWSETKVETARVFGNGIYELDGKLKTRGFKKDKRDKDPRPMRERMRYATEQEMKERKAKKGDIMVDVMERGPIHLSSSFRLKNYSMKDALVWIDKPKQMNITECKKRIWPKFTIEDLYSKQISSTSRKIDDGKLNHNEGLVWQGHTTEESNTNRFVLGRIVV